MQTLLRLLYTILILSIISCDSSNKQTKDSPVKDEKEQRFENYAKILETSIRNGDYKKLNTSWDIDLFKSKVLAKGMVATNVLESGEKYFRKVIFKVNNDMVDEVKQYGAFTLSRFHFENDVPKAFYTYKTDIGINFIEFVFKAEGDDIKIIDFYNFQQGEYYSESINKMIAYVNKYGGKKGAYVDAMELVGLAVKQANDKRYETAWKTINAISDNLLNDNYFQYKRIQVARAISDLRYYEAIEDFLALKPKNEKLQLYYKIHLYHMKKDRKKLNAAAKDLEEIVGKSELFTKWRRYR
ncbi:MAG: hypothetical protein P1P88_13535 [Bacteroidales bacterium]|nr:hypothetical protein [Bacteroidales bacterium]